MILCKVVRIQKESYGGIILKKSRILFTVLAIVAACTLFSCGPLASSKAETGTFTYTISPELREEIARFSGNDSNWEVKIEVSVWSETDGVYDKQTKAAWLNADDMELLDYVMPDETNLQFTNIPFNEPMLLSVNIYTNYSLVPEIGVTTRKPVSFSISSNNHLNIVTAKVDHPYVTPFLLTQRPENAAAYNVYTFDSVYSLIGTNPGLTSSYGRLDEDEIKNKEEEFTLEYNWMYCFDFDNCLWYINKTDHKLYKAEEIQDHVAYHEVYTTTNLDGYMPYAVYYDLIQDKITVIISSNAGQTWYHITFAPDEADEVFRGDTDPLVSSFAQEFAKNPYFETGISGEEKLLGSVDDNILYTLLSMDHSTSEPEIKIRKTSLITGQTIGEDGTAGISVVNQNAPNKKYEFNDIYVNEGKVYILFHQREVWDDPDTSKGSYQDTYFFDVDDNQILALDGTNADVDGFDFGIVDRGGIFVFDADSLTQTEIIGMPDLNVGLNHRVTVHETNSSSQTYNFFLYSDENKTQPIIKTLPIKWATAKIGETKLANPMKIVAIGPKKLVVLDGGVFCYEEGGQFSSDPSVSYSDGFQPHSRLVEINLESFSNSRVIAPFEDYSDFQASINDSHYPFKYTISSSYLNNDGDAWRYEEYITGPGGANCETIVVSTSMKKCYSGIQGEIDIIFTN